MDEYAKLVIKDELDNDCEILVLDIVEPEGQDKKEIMIYFYTDDPGHVYASYLNEDEESFSLDPLTDEDDIAFADREIDRAVAEFIAYEKQRRAGRS